MMHCNLCKNWYHSECIGIDEKNIKFYENCGFTNVGVEMKLL